MSFFKNVFTLGRYGKMENELIIYEWRRDTIKEMADEFNKSLKDQKIVFNSLKIQRKTAEKNLFLFKTILLLIKNNIKDNKADIIQDKIKIKESINLPSTVLNASTAISEIDLSKYSNDFFSNTNKNLKILSKIKNPKKEELAILAIESTISAISNGIGAIIKLNQDVNEKRAGIFENTKKILRAADTIMEIHPSIHEDTLGASEIAKTLLKANESFSIKYEELKNEVFYEKKLTLFKKFVLNEKFEIKQETIDKIIFLGSICSEYNKISQTKL